MDLRFAKELEEYVLEKDRDLVSLNNKKIALCKKYSLEKIPLNSDILNAVSSESRKKLEEKLGIKGIRSRSGVNVIAIMTPPRPCPHGKCIYCPGGGSVPQSYTGYEPATMRGIRNHYNPKEQVTNRVRQLELIGHNVSKLELIIMGGTFNSTPLEEQTKFIKEVYDGVSGYNTNSLEDAKDKAELSYRRAVGLTLETRPDYATKEHVKSALNFGTTRVELGVQTLDDKIYKKVNRGHTTKDVQNATQNLRSAGLKILYHIMPGLFSDVDKDLKMFQKLFDNNKYMPDMLKIYPCLVMENTELYNMYKREEYTPYNDEDLFEFLYKFYPKVPYYNRIMRVQRDIPSTKIYAGSKKSNMRELVQNKLIEDNVKVKEIRFREIGHRKIQKDSFKIFTEKYSTINSEEYFISYESSDREILVGFIRLSIPKSTFVYELDNSTIVRELHVYGRALGLHEKSNKIGQHKGIGTMLLEQAEEISKRKGYHKINVISGIGVREYYYKRGYLLGEYYVSKKL